MNGMLALVNGTCINLKWAQKYWRIQLDKGALSGYDDKRALTKVYTAISKHNKVKVAMSQTSSECRKYKLGRTRAT